MDNMSSTNLQWCWRSVQRSVTMSDPVMVGLLSTPWIFLHLLRQVAVVVLTKGSWWSPEQLVVVLVLVAVVIERVCDCWVDLVVYWL